MLNWDDYGKEENNAPANAAVSQAVREPSQEVESDKTSQHARPMGSLSIRQFALGLLESISGVTIFPTLKCMQQLWQR